jgi:hypothetical protein
MQQAIAGVAPPGLSEVTVMEVYPSLGGTSLGQTLGRMFLIRAGVGNVLTVGNLIALLSIPFMVPFYLGRFILPVAQGIPLLGIPLRLIPSPLERYRLTNRRVVVQRIGPSFKGHDERSIALDRFDTVDLVVHPGQQWYPAGDLVFLQGKREVFRLIGVLHPQGFRQTILKARQSFVGVRKALGEPVAV